MRIIKYTVIVLLIIIIAYPVSLQLYRYFTPPLFSRMRPAVSDIAFNEAGQLVIKIRPCETPTGVADYTELLRPDQIVMGRGYYAEGSEVTATRPFATYVPPTQATIVYTSTEECSDGLK